jgi:hypothetical protein
VDSSRWARPFVWKDPTTLARRQWLYGGHFIRQFASLTCAPGGVGKSVLELLEAVVMASGKPLLGEAPKQRCRVWYWNGEDPLEETERRLAAICLHYGLEAGDLEGWLMLGSGREADLILAEQTRDGAQLNGPNVQALTSLVHNEEIDVVIIDPFISSHRVTENDNNAIELVAKAWARLAGECNCAVELVHHTRKKMGSEETTVEDGRGGSALLAAVRVARVINPMSDAEATKAGIERRRSYFKVENGKANLGPPPEAAAWFRFVGVDLGNGSPLEPGDSVGVVCAWQWPDHRADVTAADLLKVQQALDGGRWRLDAQATEWVGRPIADALQLDFTAKGDTAKVKTLLKMWLQSGALVVVEGKDSKSNKKSFVEVGDWVRLDVETFS